MALKNFLACVCVLVISITASQTVSAQSSRFNGSETRTAVHYAGGVYRYIGNGQWSDTAKDKSYSHVLIETATDENAIYLYDSSRALTVQLNTRRFMIATGVNGAPLVDYGKITSSSGKPDQRRPLPPPQYNAPLPRMALNGSNVTGVYYHNGGFRAIGQGKWHRYKADGSYQSELMEMSREPMAIWLLDSRYNRRYKIDLGRGYIGTSSSGTKVSYSYRINKMESTGNSFGRNGGGISQNTRATQSPYYPVQGSLSAPQRPGFGNPANQSKGAALPRVGSPGYQSKGAIGAILNANPPAPVVARPQPPVVSRPRPPISSQPVNGNFVRFRSLASQKCLEVDKGQTGNNVKIVQFRCDGSDEQSLSLRSRGGNNFNIIAKHSGKCFDVPGGDPDDNVPIQHFDCDGSNEQLFAMRDLGGGTVNLLTNNGKCYDVPGGDTGDYVGINQYRCDGSTEQKFALERVN